IHFLISRLNTYPHGWKLYCRASSGSIAGKALCSSDVSLDEPEEAEMRKLFAIGLFAALGVAAMVRLGAHQSSGAIFTTLPNGQAVNFNIYPSKDLVYLDGGPGQNAPQTAAGLDDGTYVFQVTDPSGKVLLSSDVAACRQVT